MSASKRLPLRVRARAGPRHLFCSLCILLIAWCTTYAASQPTSCQQNHLLKGKSTCNRLTTSEWLQTSWPAIPATASHCSAVSLVFGFVGADCQEQLLLSIVTPVGTNCFWQITSLCSTDGLQLDVQQFLGTTGSELAVYGGNNTSSQLLGAISGLAAPLQLKASGKQLLLVLQASSTGDLHVVAQVAATSAQQTPPAASVNSSSVTTIIVGCVLGGILFLLIGGAIIIFLRLRTSKPEQGSQLFGGSINARVASGLSVQGSGLNQSREGSGVSHLVRKITSSLTNFLKDGSTELDKSSSGYGRHQDVVQQTANKYLQHFSGRGTRSAPLYGGQMRPDDMLASTPAGANLTGEHAISHLTSSGNIPTTRLSQSTLSSQGDLMFVASPGTSFTHQNSFVSRLAVVSMNNEFRRANTSTEQPPTPTRQTATLSAPRAETTAPTQSRRAKSHSTGVLLDSRELASYGSSQAGEVSMSQMADIQGRGSVSGQLLNSRGSIPFLRSESARRRAIVYSRSGVEVTGLPIEALLKSRRRSDGGSERGSPTSVPASPKSPHHRQTFSGAHAIRNDSAELQPRKLLQRRSLGQIHLPLDSIDATQASTVSAAGPSSHEHNSMGQCSVGSLTSGAMVDTALATSTADTAATLGSVRGVATLHASSSHAQTRVSSSRPQLHVHTHSDRSHGSPLGHGVSSRTNSPSRGPSSSQVELKTFHGPTSSSSLAPPQLLPSNSQNSNTRHPILASSGSSGSLSYTKDSLVSHEGGSAHNLSAHPNHSLLQEAPSDTASALGEHNSATQEHVVIPYTNSNSASIHATSTGHGRSHGASRLSMGQLAEHATQPSLLDLPPIPHEPQQGIHPLPSSALGTGVPVILLDDEPQQHFVGVPQQLLTAPSAAAQQAEIGEEASPRYPPTMPPSLLEQPTSVQQALQKLRDACKYAVSLHSSPSGSLASKSSSRSPIQYGPGSPTQSGYNSGFSRRSDLPPLRGPAPVHGRSPNAQPTEYEDFLATPMYASGLPDDFEPAEEDDYDDDDDHEGPITYKYNGFSILGGETPRERHRPQQQSWESLQSVNRGPLTAPAAPSRLRN